MFAVRFFNLRAFARRYFPKVGAASSPVTEVTSGPHRYLWDPSHARAQTWTPHKREFAWPFHRRQV